MITLHHHIFLPQCRRIRLTLEEKNLPFTLRSWNFLARDTEFLAINPAGHFPVLVDEDGGTVAGAQPAAEYLDEMYDPPLLGQGAVVRAEVRRLIDWFESKFEPEVTQLIVGEKIYRRLAGEGEPDPSTLRAGVQNLTIHMNYITWLLERRAYLAGASLTQADFAAAAQLSTIDYLGEVPWSKYPDAKAWYMNIKHRPSFRPLLQDRLPGLPPQRHYLDLDF